MEKTPAYWIDHLGLEGHPEGGFYKSTYRCPEQITDAELSVSFAGKRHTATSILFLLRSHDVSHFHRLKSDEMWYYQYGSSLTVHVIHPDGRYEAIELGPDLHKGQVMQYVVPKHAIFGSTVNDPDTYSLVGCMVTPGFDFVDFELFKRADLLAQYPEHHAIINKLTLE